MTKFYRILEHTADIGFEAYGATEEEALENSAYALVSIITNPEQIKPEKTKSIAISADDREQMLIRYLNEILYVIDGESFVPAQVKVKRSGETTLYADLYGELRSDELETRTDVKAITYHQLEFRRSDKGYTIRVFVDI